MSLAQLWEAPALPPPVTRAAISEGGELPPYRVAANWRSNRISTIDRGSRNTPCALPPPWHGPSTDDLMRNLPRERTWRERREAMVAEIREEIAVGTAALADGLAMPGREVLRGRSLAAFLDRARVALGIWERDLELGEPPEDAPRSEETTKAYR